MLRHVEHERLSRDQALQLAVLRCFTLDRPDIETLFVQSARGWMRLLFWLDTSGLALYFFDRLRELQLAEQLPANVHTRLLQNLVDNSHRMQSMVTEAIAIQDAFRSKGLVFAVLKGFSLAPHSVSSFALRSQLDLDFLLRPEDLSAAQAILVQRGYHLHGQSGRSWEYKDEPTPRTSLKQLYQHNGSRSAELHVANDAASLGQLRRRVHMLFQGVAMPVLSPEDVFRWQALHLYKHLSSEGARAAHGLEFYRHVTFRREEVSFWKHVRAQGCDDPKTRFALGFVTALMSNAMGPFAPEELTSWTSERLPEFAHRWIARFGLAAALGRAGGSKLPMILQDELEAHGLSAAPPHRRSLLRLPPQIEHPRPLETRGQQLGRNLRQLRFVLHRLRFHTVEGLRLAIERARWKNNQRTLQQTNDKSLTHA